MCFVVHLIFFTLDLKTSLYITGIHKLFLDLKNDVSAHQILAQENLIV